MPRPSTYRAPASVRGGPHRWQVVDYRNERNSERGEETTSQHAKAQAEAVIRKIGRGLSGVAASVTRPSGAGGWHARFEHGQLKWEPWERGA